jgi:hypothetical protein
MIRKIKKKDYDLYNVDGYYIGDKVIFDDWEFEVVGIDIKNESKTFDILLNWWGRGLHGIAFQVEIVYKKWTKRELYSLWVDSSRISPVPIK